MTGLSPDTTYYVRSYATNSAGTSYGTEVTFKTLAVPPTVTTTATTSITSTTATGNGNVTALGQSALTQYGHVWSTSTNPTIALGTKTALGAKSATGAFTSSITNLLPNTTYYIKAYATNTGGTSYGTESSFTTPPAPPTMTTGAITSITLGTATAGGSVTSTGGQSLSQYGHVWGTNPSPTTADKLTTLGTKTTTGSFSSSLTGLIPNTKYYIRSYGTNPTGTSYGTETSFTTSLNSSAPGTPSNLQVNAGDEEASLNWTANSELDMKEYNIYLDGVLIDTVAHPAVTYIINGLTNGATYAVSISAVNTSSKESAQTTSMTFTQIGRAHV